MNRLADQTSPYLRQHADNPVDWHPWGDEAFRLAREADRPILLSVGYSACHWCHVMAHESFEDPAVAAVMNDLFVNVKVDREERPDVDAVYMEATQAMTGSGGWPMTVFMTPDGEPFFCGTYFPKESRQGHMGFVDLCRAVDAAWRDRRGELTEQASRMAENLRQTSLPGAGDGGGPGITSEQVSRAAAALAQQHDRVNGGFGRAPKFPQTMSLELLLRTGTPEGLEAVTTSLDAMASGGIYDHLGGGFARYSVDPVWLVPHFEKMLYDQALLARVYLHAWQVTGEPRFRQVLEETVTYVLNELRHPLGGFWSAEDADSEGVEGKFYVWTPDEIRAVLGAGPDAEAAIAYWGVSERGNFEGSNILNRMHGRGDLVRPPAIEAARWQLFAARAQRVRPGLDDKVLTEWNGLMLATLAEAAAATGNADWLAAAEQTGTFLLENLRDPGGNWFRSWQGPADGTADDGRATISAFAADLAALVDAFTRLGEATGRSRWIEAARQVADELLEEHWDPQEGGLFTTGDKGEQLVARQKDLLDNATPSANSLAALGLLRLAALTDTHEYRDHGTAIVGLLGGVAIDHPSALAHLLAAADLVANGVTEIVIPGPGGDLRAAVQRRYLPRAVLAWGEPYPSPLWEGRQEGLAYVCRDYTCQAPVDDADALASLLA